MRAVTMLDGTVSVDVVSDPVPAAGQALVRTHVCGMCASDQHFLHSGRTIVELSRKLGGPYAGVDLDRPFVPGHEFVGELIDYGTGSRRPILPGRRVTSIPVMRQAGAYSIVGYSPDCPGGFGEYMLLDEDYLLEVPAGLPDNLAAMTEPLAVGLEHARRGRPTSDDVALVIGCGAIGLGVVAGLKLMGIAPIIASDFHEDRRDLAIRMGAHAAVDPRERSPFQGLSDVGSHLPTIIYECVGMPGMLQQIIEGAAPEARIVMGGYCMEADHIYGFAAQNKRLTVHFAGGEQPQDMELALRSIDEGKVDVASWLGDTITLDKVAGALKQMSDPGAPVRTVVDPRLALPPI